MPREYCLFASVFRKHPAIRPGSSRALRAAGKVTVLLCFLASHGTLCAEESNGAGLQVFEFRCEFRMPPGPGRVDGLMTSDGCRHRIAIYWMEPAVFRESASFLRCCDLLFDADAVHYWVHGIPQQGTFRLSDGEKAPLLPVQKSAESVLRSALAVLNRIGCPGDGGRVPLKLAAFLQRSRGQAHYKYAVSPNEGERGQLFDSVDSSVQILNALGREYSKETRDDGAMVWRAQKAANGPPVATVTIQRVGELGQDDCRGAFDLQTLGQWPLIREAYRVYWSCDRALAEVNALSEPRVAARSLYGKLNSYLDQNKVPPEVGWALDRLRFQAALMTADSDCVWLSAQAAVAGLCADETVPKEQCLVDLGSMSGRIQKQYPERMKEQLRPLVAYVVRHAGQDAATGVNRLMRDITGNGWFTYGELLIAQMRSAGLMEGRDADSWTARLQAARLARGGAVPADPCDSTPSTQRYLSQLYVDPPKGALDMNDVHRILNEGLAKRYTQDQPEAKRRVVEDTIRSIRLIAGEGPFCGDPEKLIPALDRFSANCLPANDAGGSFESVLATFLALSFCETSTAQDHERLLSQMQSRSRALQSDVNARLAAHGLASLVTPEDVERRFQRYERLFREYVDDPLWAPFKFPWTRDEEARLDGTLRLRLTPLEPVFEEMALKVKYGGASEELKDKTVRAISGAAQEMLPQAGFLRLPPYPGVRCQYIGGCGFSVVIRNLLYQDGDRPRERFQAMKYFHLGHRLEEVVIRERDLTVPIQRKEHDNEAAMSEHGDRPRQNN